MSDSIPTIGILCHEMEDCYPRGIQRVARAVAQQLALREDIRPLCITCVIEESKQQVCYVQPLARWLSENPLVRPQGRRRKLYIQKALFYLTPPIVLPWIYRTVRFARTAIGRLRPRRSQAMPERRPDPPELRSLRDLDCLLLFNPQDGLCRFDLSACQLVSVIHDTIPLRINEGHYWRPGSFAGSVRRCGDYSKLLVCNSETTRSDLRTFFGDELWRKSCMVHLGHDRERFTEPVSDAQSDAVLKRLGIDSSRPFFVLVGTVEERKNIKNVLRAFEYLAKKRGRGSFSVVIIGQHVANSSYKALLRRVSESVDVHLPGYLGDELIPLVLRRSAGLIFASLWEGFGIPLLEAMSARTAVITSNLSSMPEVAGPHAFYCDPYDPEDIARAMSEVLSLSPAEREKRLAAAAEYAADFTWQNTADNLLDALKDKIFPMATRQRETVGRRGDSE